MDEIVKIEENKFEIVRQSIREDFKNNAYVIEAIKAANASCFRSAIGSIWNATIDDLRRKIIYRSLEMFNKEMNPKKEIKKYDDFQDYVNDDELLEGAYKIGVIGWEAHKVLRTCKESRHLFDGHPASSEPTLLKTISIFEDCVKYVLSQECPPQIIDVDSYLAEMEKDSFDKSEIAISHALDDLPDIYKNKLSNMLFTRFVDEGCSSQFKNNCLSVSKILWNILPQDIIKQICNRVDTEINNGNKSRIDSSFEFINNVDEIKNLSTFARRYLLDPVIKKLNSNFGNFTIENDAVEFLEIYASYIPKDLVYEYVNGLTQTYVGMIGRSFNFARTDFYADLAAYKIPRMFEKFDPYAISCFKDVVKSNVSLKDRIKSSNVKLNRLRTLGKILIKQINETNENYEFLNCLITESEEQNFYKNL